MSDFVAGIIVGIVVTVFFEAMLLVVWSSGRFGR